jgi:nitroreductase
MEFSKLITARYSVRAYTQDKVEEEKLQYVLEAAQMAPTAANRQPFQLIVCQTEGREEEFKSVYNREWFSSAPILICVCGIPAEGWVRSFDKENYTRVDTAIVMDHLTLAAADTGLGTCWVAAFNPEAARKILELPDDVEPVAFTPLGYPADEPKPKERKGLSELVRYEKW